MIAGRRGAAVRTEDSRVVGSGPVSAVLPKMGVGFAPRAVPQSQPLDKVL